MQEIADCLYFRGQNAAIKGDTSAIREDVRKIKKLADKIPLILKELDQSRERLNTGEAARKTPQQNGTHQLCSDGAVSYAKTIPGETTRKDGSGTRLDTNNSPITSPSSNSSQNEVILFKNSLGHGFAVPLTACRTWKVGVPFSIESQAIATVTQPENCEDIRAPRADMDRVLKAL
jgi:hypothetical protein